MILLDATTGHDDGGGSSTRRMGRWWWWWWWWRWGNGRGGGGLGSCPWGRSFPRGACGLVASHPPGTAGQQSRGRCCR